MFQDIVLIYNSSSGLFVDRVTDAAEDYFEALLTECVDDGIQVTLKPFNGDQLDSLKEELRSHHPDAVWVAGGDGTALSIAKITAELDIPLGVLPGGTMNLLARDLGMDLDIPSAIRQLLEAQTTTVDMAELNGKPFFCLSNVGMSTRLTEQRENLRQQADWIRWPLMGWYMLKLMFAYPAMTIQLSVDGRTYQLQTRSVSISNNPLAPDSSLIPKRKSLDLGVLGVYVSHDRSLWTLPRLVFRLLTRNWQDDKDLMIFETDWARITFKGKKTSVSVMTDGELHRFHGPLEYRIKPAALTVLKPSDQP